jgi:hypothetical protein
MWRANPVRPYVAVFCELTPGLIGWLLLDLGFAHRQWQGLTFVHF